MVSYINLIFLIQFNLVKNSNILQIKRETIKYILLFKILVIDMLGTYNFFYLG